MGVGARLSRWRDPLLLGLILVVGAALRLYGLNWDGGHWLHPDERQIYFTVIDLGWPDSLAQALSPDSPLNPHFFAYGSLPLYLLKLVAAALSPLWPALRDPDNLHLAGRLLSALVDLGTVYLTYRLARRLDSGDRISSRIDDRSDPPDAGGTAPLLAAALVSLAVLPVQLAHFYTADPLLTFTVMLTLTLAADVGRGAGRIRQAALGIALGLALATKVSAAPLILVLLVAYGARPTPRTQPPAPLSAKLKPLIPALAVAALVFFVTQPYALIDWRTFLDHTIRETQIARGSLDVPYTIQYAGTLPFLYSMWQTALWGLGLPLGLVAWAALAATLIRWLRHGTWADALLLAWAGPYWLITSLLHTRHLRYTLPLVPVLCIMAAHFLARQLQPLSSGGGHRRWVMRVGVWGLAGICLAYGVAFASLYTPPHSWIAASEWIYREVPAGSILAVEHWDTALPLPLEVEDLPRRSDEYNYRVLPLYDEPDDGIKWEALAADLAASDYLVIASRRLYGSIPRVPERYPVAARYYEHLFAGDLGFDLVAEFTRGPAWLNPRLPPLPDPAPALLRPDESFVVYDHPRALVFRNAGRLPAGELLRRLDLR